MSENYNSLAIKDRRYVIVNLKCVKNNTFVHVTDLTGQETLFIKKGGQITTRDRQKGSPKIAERLYMQLSEFIKEKNITHIKLRTRNKGSMYKKTLTPSARLLNQNISKYYNVTVKIDSNPDIHGYMRPKKPRRV